MFSVRWCLALGAVIGICFTAKGSWAHYSAPFWPDAFSWASVLSIFAAMRYAFFAYSGWEGATYVAEEVKNPRKNLPLSLFVGIAGVFLLYAGANAAYIYQLPVETIKNSSWIAVDAMQMAIGGVGGMLISVAVMINTFGNVSTQVLCKARTWQAMSRDGLFFRSFAKLHPVYKTPNYSLIYRVMGVGAAFSPRRPSILRGNVVLSCGTFQYVYSKSLFFVKNILTAPISHGCIACYHVLRFYISAATLPRFVSLSGITD